MEIGITLTIIFVVLRLVGVIDWSWLWVFSPLWIGAAVIGFIFAVFGASFFFMFRKMRRFMKKNQNRFNDYTQIE
jgi:ABC-type polysaccharide/polyol phosphate export permease